MPTGDLVSLAEAREFLQKQTGQTGADDVLQSLVTRASAVIQRNIDTKITAETSTAKTFEWDGGTRVSLTPYVARTVTAVTMDPGEDDEQALSSGEWRLWPQQTKDGVYRHLLLDVNVVTGYTGGFPARQLSVTGTWGFSSVPEELKHAACVTVTAWYRGQVAGFSTAYGDATETVAVDLLPRDAFRVLDQWRRYG